MIAIGCLWGRGGIAQRQSLRFSFNNPEFESWHYLLSNNWNIKFQESCLDFCRHSNPKMIRAGRRPFIAMLCETKGLFDSAGVEMKVVEWPLSCEIFTPDNLLTGTQLLAAKFFYSCRFEAKMLFLKSKIKISCEDGRLKVFLEPGQELDLKTKMHLCHHAR